MFAWMSTSPYTLDQDDDHGGERMVVGSQVVEVGIVGKTEDVAGATKLRGRRREL